MKYSTKALIETISIPDIYIECFIATDGHEKEIKQGFMLYNKFPERLLILYVTWADVNNPADEEFCIAQFTNVIQEGKVIVSFWKSRLIFLFLREELDKTGTCQR